MQNWWTKLPVFKILHIRRQETSVNFIFQDIKTYWRVVNKLFVVTFFTDVLNFATKSNAYLSFTIWKISIWSCKIYAFLESQSQLLLYITYFHHFHPLLDVGLQHFFPHFSVFSYPIYPVCFWIWFFQLEFGRPGLLLWAIVSHSIISLVHRTGTMPHILINAIWDVRLSAEYLISSIVY